MSGSKKYGLILPDKGKDKKPIFQASHNVFANDSDSDEETVKKPVLLKPSHIVNRQAKIAQEKAVEEDPTVYQYDEIYDSMTIEKNEKKAKIKEDKKPKYIENLLKTANKRKIENERRIERQIQKEREKEGDEFADKEVFVTSAYKKKLEEMQQEEEREKREEYLESIGDVTKQKDLGGFYRHLYEQKLGSDKNVDQNKSLVETSKDSKSTSTKGMDEKIKEQKTSKTEKKNRNYRKRKISSDLNKGLSEGEIEDTDDEINHINLKHLKSGKRSKKDENIDADSDFSVDDPSSNDETPERETVKHIDGEKTPDVADDENKSGQPMKDISNVEKVNENEKLDKEVEKKPAIDIWKKRTVGEVFEQALRRYYERKAAR